jgi:formylmethanofuran dehydrogenase subunit E
MKRILILFALLGMAALAVNGLSGCAKEADATVECAGGCGMEMPKSAATEIDGKFYCAGCAAKMAGDMHEHGEGEMVACAGGCGMEIATADAIEHDGKFYCSGCAAKMGFEAAMVECAGCGKKVAQADAQEMDGKFYCSGCADHAGHGH